MKLAIAGQMIGADFLKLRRQRGVMITAAALTVGVTLLYFVIEVPHQGGEMIGARSIIDGTDLMGVWFGAFAAILIGAEAGTIDRANGVFRDLAATGRSRIALFLTRIPAAVALSLAFVLAGFLISVIVGYAFHGGTPAPSARLVFASVGWLILSTVVATIAGVGFGSLTGSRAVTVISLIGFQSIGSIVLSRAYFLHHVRGWAVQFALGQARPGALVEPVDSYLVPVSPLPDFTLPLGELTAGLAVAVITVWIVVPVLAGLWRTTTVDA